jgi:O-antigen/teichoic acid export membrane protein
MSARIHLRNLAFNWGGHAATMVVMFFLSPYVVGNLDAVSYGIWSLLNVLTGYMGIFDLGVRASVGRHVALYLGKEDPVGVDETIRAGFGFFSLVGVLILLAGILLGWLFPFLFKGVSPQHYDMVRILLPLMAINVWLSAIAAIYSSVLAAHDRFDIARGVDMAVLLIRTMGTVYVLEAGWGLWGLVFAVIVGNACALFGNRLFAGKVSEGLKSFPFLYTRNRMAELFGYGVPASIGNASVKIIGQSDLIIVGLALSVSSVREYSVGAMLILYTGSFFRVINRTLFPSIQKYVARGHDGDARHLFYRQIRLYLCSGVVVYVGYIFYSEPFINLWMLQENFGSSSVTASALVMTILAAARLPTLFTNPCISYLAAKGYVRFNAGVVFLEALVNIALSLLFVFAFGWGLLGVALGTLASRLLTSTVLIPYLLVRNTNIKLKKFVAEAVIPGVIAGSVFSVMCFSMLELLYPISWAVFFFQVASLLIVWTLIAYVFLIPSEYRERIKAKVSLS